MEIKKFVDIDGKVLVIKSRKSAVIFELDEPAEGYRFKFIFNTELLD